MTVGVPALEAFSGVREHALAQYGLYVVETALLGDNSVLGWRFKDKDQPGCWRMLAGSPWAGAKRGLSCLVMADELLVAWSAVASGYVMFARWSLQNEVVIQWPTQTIPGTSTGLAPYGLTKLALAVSDAGNNKVITSPDRGASWAVPPVAVLMDAGNGNILNVDLDNRNFALNTVLWAETDDPP